MVIVKHKKPMTNMDDLPVLLSVRDVAKLLRIRRSQVYALTAQGHLPRITLGRAIRYKKADICELLDSGGFSTIPSRRRNAK